MSEMKEKTLGDKLYIHVYGTIGTNRMVDGICKIAKEHYQKHPEELFTEHDYLKEKGCFRNMVDIDKVLEVFDEATSNLSYDELKDVKWIARKTLEQLKEMC